MEELSDETADFFHLLWGLRPLADNSMSALLGTLQVWFKSLARLHDETVE